MKRTFITLFLLFISACLGFAGPIECPFSAVKLYLIGASHSPEFHNIITQRAKKGHARWDRLSIPDDEKAFQMAIEMEHSFAMAIKRSVFDEDTPMRIREKTGAAYAKLLSYDKILDANVPLDDMGDGIGYLARYMNVRSNKYTFDDKISDILVKNHEYFELHDAEGYYKNFNMAHLLHAAKIVFKDNPQISAGNFPEQLASGTKGMPFELHAAAHFRLKKGERPLVLDADTLYQTPGQPQYPGLAKVDLWTSNGLYNIGIGEKTIISKLLRETKELASAIAHHEKAYGLYYKFVTSEMPSEANKEALRVAFEQLNQELKKPDYKTNRQLSVEHDLLRVPLEPLKE